MSFEATHWAEPVEEDFLDLQSAEERISYIAKTSYWEDKEAYANFLADVFSSSATVTVAMEAFARMVVHAEFDLRAPWSYWSDEQRADQYQQFVAQVDQNPAPELEVVTKRTRHKRSLSAVVSANKVLKTSTKSRKFIHRDRETITTTLTTTATRVSNQAAPPSSTIETVPDIADDLPQK